MDVMACYKMNMLWCKNITLYTDWDIQQVYKWNGAKVVIVYYKFH